MPTKERPDMRYATTAELKRELKARAIFYIEGTEDELGRTVGPTLEPGQRYAVIVIKARP